MLKEIHFMGHREAGFLEPDWGTVVISILDPTEEGCRPKRLHEFRDAIELHFVDVYERPGAPKWPEIMSAQEHVAACTMETGKAPEIGDAQRIVEFIDRYHKASEPVNLVVHCYGGVSRSAAVAKWAGMTYQAPLPQLDDGIHDLDGANPRVMRLLRKAFAMLKSARPGAC
ncbi:hypothetical protein [Hydrogenophaga sp. 2FB]|uniref:hypothetical protein n=1 Tax=Hydrogenophaga sp. 2FB TaxID=2502187 RepID=UPI0010F6DAAA|nr:hypothetical protein [Hydrogenophaga sp. 2FB]